MPILQIPINKTKLFWKNSTSNPICFISDMFPTKIKFQTLFEWHGLGFTYAVQYVFEQHSWTWSILPHHVFSTYFHVSFFSYIPNSLTLTLYNQTKNKHKTNVQKKTREVVNRPGPDSSPKKCVKKPKRTYWCVVDKPFFKMSNCARMVL